MSVKVINRAEAEAAIHAWKLAHPEIRAKIIRALEQGVENVTHLGIGRSTLDALVRLLEALED